MANYPTICYVGPMYYLNFFEETEGWGQVTEVRH